MTHKRKEDTVLNCLAQASLIAEVMGISAIDVRRAGVNVGREWRGECGATSAAASIIPWLRNCFIAHIRLLNIWGVRQDN